jgi:hypothetical protein
VSLKLIEVGLAGEEEFEEGFALEAAGLTDAK